MMHEDVLESLPMGILILNVEGSPILSNSYAQQICRQLLKTHPELRPSTASKFPQPIQRIYQAVLESQELFPDRPIIIEDTISLAATTIHLRARWLDLEIEPYILIMIEAQDAIQPTLEAEQFNLTEREAEVWLLRRAGYAYKDIAADLQITLTTVKKHIKSIHTKRELSSWADRLNHG